MNPQDLRGPSRGLSLTAAPQGRWASDSASALPPLLHFPFGSLQGWVGAGRASPSGLGSPSLPSPLALSRGLAQQPGNPRLEMGPIPVCELSVSLGNPGSSPSEYVSRCPTARGCSRASRCGPAAGRGALEPRCGRSKASSSTRFDRCQRRKKVPARDCHALTAKRAFVCSEKEWKNRNECRPCGAPSQPP